MQRKTLTWLALVSLLLVGCGGPPVPAWRSRPAEPIWLFEDAEYVLVTYEPEQLDEALLAVRESGFGLVWHNPQRHELLLLFRNRLSHSAFNRIYLSPAVTRLEIYTPQPGELLP